MELSDFSDLGLKQALYANLATLGYTRMTPIQAAALPPILAARDVIGQGKTGSGKTAAFGLGLLQSLDSKKFCIQALVLCPTRELSDQVALEIRRLARGIHNIKVLSLCGGRPLGPQVDSLRHGAHIIVGTPGRIDDHLNKGNLSFQHLRTLVLDEADRMLDMGFAPVIDGIVSRLPSERQTLLFSATFPPDINNLSRRVMQAPTLVQLEEQHDGSSIEQAACLVPDGPDRAEALAAILLERRPDTALVFCNTRRDTQFVARMLGNQGFAALALHGELEQRERDEILAKFTGRAISILIATDVAARGLDIDNIDAVINYQPARDSDTHLHRIGRTARAGNPGYALTLYSNGETYRIERMEQTLGTAFPRLPVPTPAGPAYKPPMVLLQVDGGRRQKLRPGDILGALTGDAGIAAERIGKIQIMTNCTYVAVRRQQAEDALQALGDGKIKGRSFRAREV
ncbi:MAG: ATP-dependent RNA helicase DbpA [Pseudomonadota bacterium]